MSNDKTKPVYTMPEFAEDAYDTETAVAHEIKIPRTTRRRRPKTPSLDHAEQLLTNSLKLLEANQRYIQETIIVKRNVVKSVHPTTGDIVETEVPVFKEVLTKFELDEYNSLISDNIKNLCGIAASINSIQRTRRNMPTEAAKDSKILINFDSFKSAKTGPIINSDKGN